MTEDNGGDVVPPSGAQPAGGMGAAEPLIVEPAAEREWWDDPSLPWQHKPEKADLWCLTALGIAGVYGLIMLPLRPVILGLAPHLLGSLGYRTGIIMTGALAAVGNPWWPLVLIVGSIMTIKFHWIYWWAGRRWGRAMMDVFAKDKSPRTQRRYERVWDATNRYATPAMLATFLPLPIPAAIVYAALGAAGMRLRRFLIVDALGAVVSTAGYMYAGFMIGEPAVALMEVYGRYMWYLSIALLVGMIAVAMWRARRRHATMRP